jgi:hypothetical protein
VVAWGVWVMLLYTGGARTLVSVLGEQVVCGEDACFCVVCVDLVEEFVCLLSGTC